MHIEIISPETTIFSGEIQRVKFPGKEGSFEVLNNHAPIVALLKKGNIVITEQNNQITKIEISGGVVEIKKNKIIVLAD
ncbi:MAG: ATP synthase F1 subunit epsilon [Bacteroidales bacterium]|jgi:F-type H+-transporting ATPase subunit epsilon|nr:ATP synthase F1 subunit epsilon [Bacteroidales bacterium]MDD4214718.1 ATP synthase F1 subunit epsilon [Bacteroidales bacterium]